jgi:hypothetical protein
VAALEFECSTSRELGVIQEQCSKWANGVLQLDSFTFSSLHICSLTGLTVGSCVLFIQCCQHHITRMEVYSPDFIMHISQIPFYVFTHPCGPWYIWLFLNGGNV